MLEKKLLFDRFDETRMPYLSVVIPLYNEEASIEGMIDEAIEVLRQMNRTFEVIAVDDGSTDQTYETLLESRKKYPELKIISFRGNAGQTAAFDAGFRASTGKFVVTMDGDMQNDPHDIPVMVAKLEEGFDYIAGWRRQRKDAFIIRKLPSWTANFIIRKATGTHFHDLGCSLKAYRSEIVKQLGLYGETHRFIGVIVAGMGAKICEIEVNHRPRTAGRSKYTIFRAGKVVLDLLTVLFLQRFRTKPLYLFGGLGVGAFATSAIVSMITLYHKFALGAKVHRNPLFNIAVFLAVVGVQLFVLGLMAELMTRTYFESSGKTPYLIAKTAGFEPAPQEVRASAV